jgi:hypothetical protein
MLPKNLAVVAHLPAAVEITKRTTKNSLTMDVKDGSTKIGTLVVGRVTVEWWPESNQVNAHRGDWHKFAEIMKSFLNSGPSVGKTESQTQVDFTSAKPILIRN